MDVRRYRDDDLAAVHRVWREVAWVEGDDTEPLAQFLRDATTVVAVVDGEAEGCGSVHRGVLLHTDDDLDTAVVSSITTSRVGRKQGIGRAVLDRLLLDAAADGASIAVLGMFEQGFYDRSGFGTGAEMVFTNLDPASLPADLPYRRPDRLTVDDAGAMAGALAARARGHGGVVVPSVGFWHAEAAWSDGGFGLGYRDDRGDVTHFVWCTASGEHGPYSISAWAWRTTGQLRELLGVLRSLGDQVRWLSVPEPWCLQLQPMLTLPARQRTVTKGTKYEYGASADAWWQARILDLPSVMGAVRTSRPVRLRVTVSDPLEQAGLVGVAGDWTLTLTPDGSHAERLRRDATADLRCSVNTLTRILLGVRRPSAVLATDGVDVAPHVAAALDASLQLPRPDVGIGF